MLHKKINSQKAQAPSTMKYLEDRQVVGKKSRNEDDEAKERNNNRDNGCKWVKTDAECKFNLFNFNQFLIIG